MTRPAGRQDLRARAWVVIRDERSPASQVDIALRALALVERADLADDEAEREVRRVLDQYVIDDDGGLTYVGAEPTEATKGAAM